MIKRTVVSPAGEEIEIVPDADWLAATSQPDQAIRQLTARKPLLGALWKYGAYNSPTGRATLLLHADAVPLGYGGSAQAINAVIAAPVMLPAIRTRTNGKRRYEIGLDALPESWFRKLDAEWPHVNGKTPATATAAPITDERQAAETVAALVLPDDADREAAETMDALLMPPVEEPQPVEAFAPPIDLEIASSVAMALLTQVVEIISAGSPADVGVKVKRLEADLADVADKLARRLSENDAMRRKLREVGDELHALKHERDGLRQRLRATEANLQAATNGDATRIINERVREELAKVMRATPAGTHGKDDA